MNTIKKTLVLAFAAFSVSVCSVYAANEAAISDGNVSNTLMGSVDISTGTGRNSESRRVNVDDLGEIKVTENVDEVVVSTGFGVAAGGFSAGNTSNTFSVSPSTWYSNNACRGFQDNCNVVRLASVASPVYVESVQWLTNVAGNGALTPGRTRVRLFDSQGSTGTSGVPTNMFFDSAQSTGTQIVIGHWCSSGTVIMKDSAADILVTFGKQAR